MVNNLQGRVNAREKNILLLSLLFAVVAVFGTTLFYGFVWDDVPTVVSNPSLLRWRTLLEGFTHDFWGLHEVPARSGYWRPVPTMLYVLVAQAVGKSPWAFHLLNLVFHACVVACVFQLFVRLGLRGIGLMVALFYFALHPIHAEAVSFVSALPDLCAAFFGLSFLLLGFSFGGIACLALALLSKESAVFFPAVYFALHWEPKSNAFWKNAGIAAALVVLYAFCHWEITRSVGQRAPWGGALDKHLGTVGFLFFGAWRLILFPFQLSPTETFPISGGVSDYRVWLAWVGIIAVVVTFYSFRNRFPKPWIGFLLFILFWIPASNLIPAEGLLSDRYLYLPTLGAAFILGGVLHTARSRWPLLALLVLWSGYTAIHALPPWKNEETLWRKATLATPESVVAWNEWGKIQLKQGKPSEAEQAFRQAVKLAPSYVEGNLNLAMVLMRSGVREEARKILNDVSLKEPHRPEVYDLLAAAADAEGNFREAAEFSGMAAALSPKNWKYQFNFGTALLKYEKPEEAAKVFFATLELNVSDPPLVMNNLAAAYVKMGKKEEAVKLYKRVLQISPDNLIARNNLSILAGN